jgi:hypothetical protein
MKKLSSGFAVLASIYCTSAWAEPPEPPEPPYPNAVDEGASKAEVEGSVAVRLGAERDDLAFLVLMAGPAVGGTEKLGDQNREIFTGTGVSERLLQARLEILRNLNLILTDADEAQGPEAKARKYLATVLASYSAAQRQLEGLREEGAAER